MTQSEVKKISLGSEEWIQMNRKFEILCSKQLSLQKRVQVLRNFQKENQDDSSLCHQKQKEIISLLSELDEINSSINNHIALMAGFLPDGRN